MPRSIRSLISFSISEEALSKLHLQLSHKFVRKILQILHRAQSSFTQSIDGLSGRLSTELRRAESNILFLHLLTGPCDELSRVESIDAVAFKLPRIINVIFFIRTHSEHCGGDASIAKLVRYVGNQIICICQQKLDVEATFEGAVADGIKLANMSIDCCLHYKALYELLAADRPADERRLESGLLFQNVDTFVQRLYDFIEICDGIAVFGERASVVEGIISCSVSDDGRSSQGSLLMPSVRLELSGDRGEEFETTCRQIERIFDEELEKLRRISRTILDVRNLGWRESMDSFRRTTAQLDLIIENLIINVFAGVANCEEGLHALTCLHRFAQRESVAAALKREAESVWRMFAAEIAATNEKLSNDKLRSLPKHAAHAVDLKCNRDRVVRLQRLIARAEYLPPVHDSSRILRECDRLAAAATANIQKSYDAWLQSLSGDISAKLSRPLLTRCLTHPGLFECNTDFTVFDVFGEAALFKVLGFGFPVHVSLFLARETGVQFAFDGVVETAFAFNRVVMSLTDKERLLFRPLIDVCVRVLLPGLHKLTWTGDGLETQIGICNRHIAELRVFLTLYRTENDAVVSLCEKISEINLVNLDLHAANSIEEIEEKVIHFCQAQLSALVQLHNEMFESIFRVFRALEKHLEKVSFERFLWSFID